MQIRELLPCLQWLKTYDKPALMGDLLAAVIVTIMLIPQSLAYALLAGLPAEVGIYASIFPLIVYAIFGTSRSLSVGPVAVISIMTASAIAGIAEPGAEAYLQSAIFLALISGLFMLAMGILRLGFLANFLSHPVVASFITGSAIVIIFAQLDHLLGVPLAGDNVIALLMSAVGSWDGVNSATLMISLGTLGFLFALRFFGQSALQALGLSAKNAAMLAKTGPVLGVLVTSAIAYLYQLEAQGVALVGQVPAGLPSLGLPEFEDLAWKELAIAAVFISLIGFVESVSVGQTLAAKRKYKIHPNQELIGLGGANIAASFSGGYPVTGGFARSVVNFEAGAVTPAAGAFTAVGMMLTALFFTPYIAFLPKATLAATIVVAVTSLVDFSILAKTWRYSRTDFFAAISTLIATVAFGIEAGVMFGVLSSLAMHLYKTSKPHIAVVGEVPGTEHFRNVDRHHVITQTEILSVRIDESLYFANAAYIEEQLEELLASHPDVEHLVLQCTAVNEIDISGLEVLHSINNDLASRNIQLHLSEVKGPVMDVLKRSDFVDKLTGEVYLSQHQAVQGLSRRQSWQEEASTGYL